MSLDLFDEVSTLWRYPFMRHALVSGSAVAVMGAAVGWFVVLRREAYAAHSLAMVAFPGATTAAYLGVAPVLGYFGMAVAGAGAIAALGPVAASGTYRGHSANVGSVQALALAVGLLFASLYEGSLANVTAFLFGSFLGISATEATALVIVAVAALAVLALLGRPLLFASVEPAVAAGSGVPVRALNVAFLVLVGVAVAAASQFTGVLLVFSVVVTPPAIAQAVTARPALSLGLSMAVSVSVVWAGLGAAFFTDRPAGFWITTIGFGAYVVVRAVVGSLSVVRRRRVDRVSP
ncbi:MAG: metal ABC transporter permease [Acidimicrobiales bacterium]